MIFLLRASLKQRIPEDFRGEKNSSSDLLVVVAIIIFDNSLQNDNYFKTDSITDMPLILINTFLGNLADPISACMIAVKFI